MSLEYERFLLDIIDRNVGNKREFAMEVMRQFCQKLNLSKFFNWCVDEKNLYKNVRVDKNFSLPGVDLNLLRKANSDCVGLFASMSARLLNDEEYYELMVEIDEVMTGMDLSIKNRKAIFLSAEGRVSG